MPKTCCADKHVSCQVGFGRDTLLQHIINEKQDPRTQLVLLPHTWIANASRDLPLQLSSQHRSLLHHRFIKREKYWRHIHSGGLTASESRVAHPSCMKSPVQQSVEVSGLSTGQICENTTQSVWIYSRLWAILLKCHLLHQWQQMCAHLNSHFLTRFRISLC